MEVDLTQFQAADAAIATMSTEYMPMTVHGVTDTLGCKRVHDARMVVKNKRVEVEKVRATGGRSYEVIEQDVDTGRQCAISISKAL